MPTPAERSEYLSAWRDQLAEETGWKEDEIAEAAARTDGYSFAYLKELIMSSVMSWMHDTEANFASVLNQQADTLRRQLKTEAADNAVTAMD